MATAEAGRVAVCYNGQNGHKATIMLRSTILGLSLLVTGLALAQTPKLEPVEESETPITAKPKPQTPPGKVKERTRQNERGSETEVDTGRTTYTVKQKAHAANPAVGGTTSFKVLEFDLNRKKKPDDKDKDSAATATEKASVPPPPPMQPENK